MFSVDPVVKLQLGQNRAQLDRFSPSVLIGRDALSCGLVADEGNVSRRHAEVVLQGSQVYIRDLGSSNGTWVDGQPVLADLVPIRPGQQVFVGFMPLYVEWQDASVGATVVGEIPAELRALIEAKKSAPAEIPAQAPAAPAGGAAQVAQTQGAPATFTYRRQGSNNNGVLLIALPGDTFANDSVIEGYVEFTATDEETISSIIVELAEHHDKGPKKGHVWDRVLVRQGPWRSKDGDVVPSHFQLRVPPGTSPSGPKVTWEVRGLVDINWAFDVNASSPITMRNVDIEKIRDALGVLDYRIDSLESEPLGQSFAGTFEPPAHLRSQVGIQKIDLAVEYLGESLKIEMVVKKTKLFKFDRRSELLFPLQQLRAMSPQDLSRQFDTEIAVMMGV